jgi:hypothetical protein
VFAALRFTETLQSLCLHHEPPEGTPFGDHDAKSRASAGGDVPAATRAVFQVNFVKGKYAQLSLCPEKAMRVKRVVQYGANHSDIEIWTEDYDAR